MARWLYWPVCGAFGHEALGLRGAPVYDKMMTGSQYVFLWHQMNRRVP
jgi:hypothetical protein